MPDGSALLVVHRAKILRLRVARNAPEHHYSRLHRAGVVIFVVAQQVQDLSALSITNQTVGVGLSRLRCETIVWRINKIPSGPKLDALTAEKALAGRTFTRRKN